MNIPAALMLPERRLEGSLIGGTGPMRRMLQFAAVGPCEENVQCFSVTLAWVSHLAGSQVLPDD
jgi:hypothetical protein